FLVLASQDDGLAPLTKPAKNTLLTKQSRPKKVRLTKATEAQHKHIRQTLDGSATQNLIPNHHIDTADQHSPEQARSPIFAILSSLEGRIFSESVHSPVASSYK